MQTNDKEKEPHNNGLSPAALMMAYRLQSLKDRTKYAIIFTKLGDTWIYEIEEQKTKVECAQ